MNTLIKAAQDVIACANPLGTTSNVRVPKYVMAALEQAIAQELASQSANTKPVVSQKTEETVDKDCDTCNNRHKRMHQEPCFSCHGYTNWEPKP